jgi:DNA/RNA endonuclease YhcR with UshA esterase domain
MEKEEKVVVVLLFMALSSLLTAYLCFGSETADAMSGEARQYTKEAASGDKVFLEAEVLSKSFTHKGEHLILQVDYNSEVLTVFIPKTAGAEALDRSIKKGDFIRLTGIVSDYEGTREVKVERKEDISLSSRSQ